MIKQAEWRHGKQTTEEKNVNALGRDYGVISLFL